MVKIYGKNTVRETVYAGKRKIYDLFLDEKLKRTESKLIDCAGNNGVSVKFVERSFLDKNYPPTHQGYAAFIEDYGYQELDDCLNAKKKQFFLMLDGIEDPANFGAILRTADAALIDGIIIPKNNSVSLNATVAKVSTGAIEHVNVIAVNNLNRTIDELKKKGFWIVGTDRDGTLPYTDLKFDTSTCIIIGSEGFGIRKLTKEKCDFIASIPMHGHVNSLNASVSSALLMYEYLRKK